MSIHHAAAPLSAGNAAPPGINLPLGKPQREPVSLQDFRDSMAALAGGVCIVTARDEDERAGRTATAVMSLSGSPPSLLVSLDNNSLLAAMIRKRGTFSIAMLTRAQWTIADAFAGRIASPHRFKCGHWSEWPSGNPKLELAMTAIDCDVIGRIETGTHALIAGAMVDIAHNAGQAPLVWHDRGYRTVR